jgi:hypothetical protein
MTSLNTAVETSLAGIRDISANIARLTEEAKTARKAAIEPFLDALAASGEVSLIVVYGYTPGFNDGEPCEHSGDFFVNIQHAADEDMLDRDFELDLPDELTGGLRKERSWNSAKRDYVIDAGAAEGNAALCREHGHVYAKPSPPIMKAISDVIFDAAEEENGTNYFVTYVLKDGKFGVNSGEYDCGY